jgi:hypothetical protein
LEIFDVYLWRRDIYFNFSLYFLTVKGKSSEVAVAGREDVVILKELKGDATKN